MPNLPNSYTIGRLYELKAIKVLKSKGFRVIKHNFVGAFAQIDIVALKKNKVFLIEVKKTTDQFLSQTLKQFHNKQKVRMIEEAIKFKSKYLKNKNHKIEIMLIIFANKCESPLLLNQSNLPTL